MHIGLDSTGSSVLVVMKMREVVLGWDEVNNDTSFSCLEKEIEAFFKENRIKPMAILIYVLNLRHSINRYSRLSENEKKDICNLVWQVLEWLKKSTNLGSGLKSEIPLWYTSASEWKSFRDGFFR